jgi:hypothetical protein
MDIKHKPAANAKIRELSNAYVGAMNDAKFRDEFGYKIKCFLEKENIDFETLNLYTTPERIDQGFVDIRIDEELFPFSEIDILDSNNWVDFIDKWEMGFLNSEDTIKLFQYLIDEGHVWNLQGFYGRMAEDFIEAGFCTLSYKKTKGHYIWGNPDLPTKFELRLNAPGTDAYVQKRKELSDDEFFEWSNLQINSEDEE